MLQVAELEQQLAELREASKATAEQAEAVQQDRDRAAAEAAHLASKISASVRERDVLRAQLGQKKQEIQRLHALTSASDPSVPAVKASLQHIRSSVRVQVAKCERVQVHSTCTAWRQSRSTSLTRDHLLGGQ